MTVIATALKHLMAAGLEGDALVAAIEEIEADLVAQQPAQNIDVAAERKRAYDREYRREERVNRTMSYESPESNDLVPKEYISNPPASSEPKGSPEAKPRPKSKLVLPDWLPAEPWASFVEMRRKIKNAPFTDAAARGVIREIDKFRSRGHSPTKLLEKAVIRGWRTVFADDDTKGSDAPTGKQWTPDERRALLGGLEPRLETAPSPTTRRESTGPPGRSIGQIARQAGITH